MPYRLVIITAAIALAAPGDLPAQEREHAWGARSAPDYEPAYAAQFRAPIVVTDHTLEPRELASGLVHPWAVAELPDGLGFLVTERPGRLRHVATDGTVGEPITGVPEVENRAPDSSWATQAGLLDVKLGPTFADDRMIYLTYAKPLPDDMSATAVARGVLSEDLRALTDVEDIFVQEPPSPTRMHYGSRIVFDGDDIAFITTGEHSSLMERDFSQRLDTTYGKIVRVHPDGSVPADNPFVGAEGALDTIWSYGHRNVQGAVMKDGLLYTIEHGPAGGDELNLPLPGRNYGWPVVSYGVRYNGPPIGTGRQRMPGMEEPLYYWDPVIAPGDMTVYAGEMFPAWEGDFLIGGLISGGLVRLDLDGPLVEAEERVLPDLGRVRDVEVLADGSLLVATDYEAGALVHITAATD
jgi:glucose/arabinose dehydrogenase